MDTSITIELGRRTLEAAITLALPLLLAATVVSLLINIVQVLTSLQETTISTVPRLLTMAAAAFLLLPWMVRKIGWFTTDLFHDFRPFLR
ncbi:export protein FliQ, family 3 [Candidatus Koribacter versatilis Ellin345]|uniref:Export protein FliQ, family 3 n=1 Tax=Koribacter versatilis (strain Ellin345) TaxID=204669 RepID=Q1IR57_KORVE|nr:flagellar biosynthetic protein FliQ [Candidatus Koribacter versatilis]ABF40643.1 export protein FliQ, family 3 [Candidatus Koribacter versatilis Ellin345]